MENEKTEFEWTDELKKEFANYLLDECNIADSLGWLLLQFKASKQKPDWEVLSIIGHVSKELRTRKTHTMEDFIKLGDIHSVRYKEEVFTVGGWGEFLGAKFQIARFEIDGKDMWVYDKSGGYQAEIHQLTKLQPIFMTFDGQPVFDRDDTVYFIQKYDSMHRSKNTIHEIKAKEYSNSTSYTFFKSPQKAEEYLIKNAENLSLAYIYPYGQDGLKPSYDEIVEYQRKKLGL